MQEHILAIDLGTSELKVAVFDENLCEKSKNSIEIQTYTPEKGHAEQIPSEWWEKLGKIVRKTIQAKNNRYKISAIGITGHMHSFVMLDHNKKVLDRAILWSDNRANQETRMLTKNYKNIIFESTGNNPIEAFSLPKLLWLKNNRAKLFKKIDKIIFPKDYLKYKLTGEIITDFTDASSSMAYDINRKRWSDRLLKTLNLNQDIFPEIETSSKIIGYLAKNSAEKLGTTKGIPVINGAGDLAATVAAMGLNRPGNIGVNLGTAGQLLQTVEKRNPGEDIFYAFSHPLHSGRLFLLGSIYAAGLSFKWFKNTFGRIEQQMSDLTKTNVFEILIQEAKLSNPGAKGLLFLPYLTGSSTPYQDSRDRGAFIGLTNQHKKQDIIRAIIEGITYEANKILELYKKNNYNPGRVIIGGGATRSDFWQQLQADIFGCPVYPFSSKDASLFGAALLAGLGTGLIDKNEIINSIPLDAPKSPTEKQERYQKHYEVYKKIRNSIHDISVSLSQLN